jgi:hypothetical protein
LTVILLAGIITWLQADYINDTCNGVYSIAEELDDETI